MILNENESKNLLTKVLSNSKADSAFASLSGNNIYNLRFARNSLTTNGFSDGLSVSISSNIGKKAGNVSTNKFDENSKVEDRKEQVIKLIRAFINGDKIEVSGYLSDNHINYFYWSLLTEEGRSIKLDNSGRAVCPVGVNP